MRLRTRNVLAALACAVGVAMSPVGPAHAEGYLQCVPFARTFSGIQIFGDAYTWWQQASGKYNKGFVPKTGAVLCTRCRWHSAVPPWRAITLR